MSELDDLHLRWSSRYFDESSAAKKSPSRWSRPRVSSAIFPASSSHYIRTSGDCESPDMIRHAHSHNGFSSESIPLCQVNQPKSESPEHVISINVPVISSNVNERTQKSRRKSDGSHLDGEQYVEDNRYARLHSESENIKKKHNKYLNSLENISDSLQNLLDCIPIYNFCQSKKNLDFSKQKRKKDESELKPLFFVGKRDFYFKNDEASNRNVIHHFSGPSMSPEETEMYQKLLPQESKPRRYNKSSLKKQKISLYDEKEFDLYKTVPIITETNQEIVTEPVPVEPKPKPKPKTLTDAEIKRRTFLRKISLQDTYLNYNQDYWLDFEKSGRFNKSIDLGFVGNGAEENEKKSEKPGPKPRLSETITEKSNELSDSITQEEKKQTTHSKAINRQSEMPLDTKRVKYFSRGDSEPLIIRHKKCSCNNCGNRVLIETENQRRESNNKTLAEIVADFKLSSNDQSKSWFFIPSNENIPLFCERNGHIETDFDMLNNLLDEECLLIDKTSSSEVETDFVYNGDEVNDGLNYHSQNDLYELTKRLDLSDFCEIKLNNSGQEENIKRSSIFNFQGGQAFFGENKNSTSEESDVFINETENLGHVDDRMRKFSVPIVSVSSPSKSPSPEMN